MSNKLLMLLFHSYVIMQKPCTSAVVIKAEKLTYFRINFRNDATQVNFARPNRDRFHPAFLLQIRIIKPRAIKSFLLFYVTYRITDD